MLNSKNQTFWLVLLTQTKFSQLKRKYSQVQRYSQFLYIKECMKDKLASSNSSPRNIYLWGFIINLIYFDAVCKIDKTNNLI